MPSRAPDLNPTPSAGRHTCSSKQDVGLATLAVRTCINLVSRVPVHTFEFLVSRSRSSPHNYYLGYPLGRFAGLKHRQAPWCRSRL
jgi:hypothetical protein